MLDNLTNLDELTFSLKPPVQCSKLKIIGIVYIVLFVLCLLSNSMLLKIFIKNRDLQTPINFLIIFLTIFNLLGTLIQLPFVIISNLLCRWPFEKVGCRLSAFIMFFIGCTSIYLICAISCQRLYIVQKAKNIRNLSVKISLYTVVFCSLKGLFWASMPILGWSYYSLEAAYTSCSCEWRDRSVNVVSYNIALFGFVYLLPLLVIFITSYKLIMKVKGLNKIFRDDTKKNARLKRRIAKSKTLTIILLIIIGIFILSWTPYAIASMYTAFWDHNGIPPIIDAMIAIFAKSSMLWTSLFYLITNKQIRSKIFQKIDTSYSFRT